MADENKIKQRIELEGEKEYNAALAEARRNLKTLRSELKAETAELGSNATAQQKAEVRTKSLQKQIKEQEKVVKTYQNALKEVKEKYGDNEEAVAKWEQKLNEARATLANMKNSLDDVSEGMKGVESSAQLGVVATNSFADSLGKIADVGNSVSTAIENTFMSVVGFVSDAISELWSQLMDVAARANNWTDIATMWNSTASNIQKWYHAVGAEGKDFAKMTNFVTKIVTGDQKKIAEATLVSAEAYEDQWEYAMAVMDSLSKMGTSQQIEALKNMGISGAKQEGWLDMLKAWADIQENAQKFDAENGGLGLTEEELDKANRLAISVAELKESWMALKDHALVNLLGDLSLNVTGNIQQIIEAFDEYFKAEDQAGRDAAIQKIKDNIIEIFENIKEAIKQGIELLDQLAEELKGSDDATARALGEILDQIVGALDWFAKEENWQTVVKAFEALIGVWAAGEIVGALGNLAAFGAHIATLSGWLGLGKGGNGGGGSPTVAPTGGGWVTGASNLLTGVASTVSSFIIQNGLVNMIPMVGDWLTHESPFAGLLTGKETAEEFGEKVAETFSEESVDAFKDNWDANNPDANVLAKLGRNNILFWDKVAKLNASANEWILPDDATAEEIEEFVKMQEALANTVEEYLDLDEKHYTDEDRENAVQDWFDAWRTSADDEESAWEWLQEVFGDDWGDVYDSIIQNLDKLTQQEQMDLTDIPSDWWNNPTGLTSEDISGFRSVPGMMKAAVREGVSGIRVVMDGQAVGNLVAPYVSQTIARDIM